MSISEKNNYNLFYFPFILCFVQFCFVFFSIIGSGFDFVFPVIIMDSLILIIWLALFASFYMRKKTTVLSFQNIVLFFLFIYSSFIIVSYTWFQGSGVKLNFINAFFKGHSFLDNIYHSAIAESFITNGYPSIQINAPNPIAYHTLSHFFIALISYISNVPCFVTYTYIYPVIAFPLLVYLFQKLASIAKIYFKCGDSIGFIDIFAIILSVIGLSNKNEYAFGMHYNAWYFGESYCVSLILLFSYFCILYRVHGKKKVLDVLNLFVFIPVFILILSYCKISTGFMFCVGTCYYIFRKNLFKNLKWLLAFYYVVIFMLYYFIPGKLVPGPDYVLNTSDSSMFELFHYAKNYTKNIFYGIGHYLIMFLPLFFVFLFSKNKKLFSIKNKHPNSDVLILETLVLSTFVCVLPGILLKIKGGSAYLFEGPVFLCSLVFFIGMDIPNKINSFFIAKFSKKNIQLVETPQKQSNVYFIGISFLFVFVLCFEPIDFRNMIKTTLFNRLDNKNIEEMSKVEKIRSIFSSSDMLENNDYIMLAEIRELTKKHRKDYCVFLEDDFDLIKTYDDIWYAPASYLGVNKHLIDPYMAVSAYTGLPVINAMYLKDNVFYRGDDAVFGEISEFGPEYSIPPAVCGEKVTLQNMEDVALKLNKKHIIVIKKDGFEVVAVTNKN